jgi:hypothetical protein
MRGCWVLDGKPLCMGKATAVVYGEVCDKVLRSKFVEVLGRVV